MSNDPSASRWKMITRGPPRCSGVTTHSQRPSPSMSPAVTNPPNVKLASPNGSVGGRRIDPPTPLTTAIIVLTPGPVTKTVSATPSPLKSPVAVRTSPRSPGNTLGGITRPGGLAYAPDSLGAYTLAIPRGAPPTDRFRGGPAGTPDGPGEGGGGGEEESAGLMVRVYTRLPDKFALFVAVMAKSKEPAFVGIPKRAPEVLFRLSPGGRAPEVTAKVYGPGGPDAVSVRP
jgi:hypothetical protein